MGIKSARFIPILKVMRPSDKLRSDILRLASEAGKYREDLRPSFFRSFIEQQFGSLPANTREAIAQTFEEKRGKEPDRAVEWLSILGGILMRDYDESPLSGLEWRELRDILSAGSGELDMDTLSYAMALVVEHKAL